MNEGLGLTRFKRVSVPIQGLKEETVKFTKALLGGVAFASVAAFTLAGCSSDTPDASGSPTAGGGGGSSDAIILANGSEPQNGLIPTSTNETGGGRIVDSLFAGLVYYDGDGKPHNEVADSITQLDPTKYEVKLADGWKFTNGEAVTAKSFVDAWNWGAQLSNAQNNSYFFEDIEGFSWDADSELTGLEIVDDLTFTIKLNKAASDFPLRLGYTAFFPLPSVAFDDMEAFGQNPIGNGPYKFASETAWQHDIQLDVVTNPDYKGGRTPQNGGVTFTFYQTPEAMYADLLSDQVDVIDQIPDSSMQVFEDELGDRAVNQAAAVFQSVTIPSRLDHFSGEEGELRRKAISMSINRDEITDVIFQGSRTPASDFTSPVIDGWSDSVPGSEVLKYNPEEAKKLWAEADAISPWSGSFQIGYNADGGHQTWVDATTNSIKNTLGIDASGNPVAVFGDFRDQITSREIQTAFRSGWQADYPGLYNFLGPLYATNAGSNDGDYSSAEFDAVLAEGSTATDVAVANEKYQAAQEILFKDLPAIPLWYSNVTGGFSNNVDNVVFGWNSQPLYYEITKN
jgi:oligopeptide transport system substrate-binding protein